MEESRKRIAEKRPSGGRHDEKRTKLDITSEWNRYCECTPSLSDLSGRMDLLKYFLKQDIIRDHSQHAGEYWLGMLHFIFTIANAVHDNTIRFNSDEEGRRLKKDLLSLFKDIVVTCPEKIFTTPDKNNILHALLIFITPLAKEYDMGLNKHIKDIILIVLKKIVGNPLQPKKKEDLCYLQTIISKLYDENNSIINKYLDGVLPQVLGIDPDKYYLLYSREYERLPLPSDGKHVLCHYPLVCEHLCAANEIDQKKRMEAVNKGLKNGGVQPLYMSMKYLPIIFQEIIYAVEVQKNILEVRRLLEIIQEDNVDQDYTPEELKDARELYSAILQSVDTLELDKLLSACCKVVKSNEYKPDIVVTPCYIRALFSQYYMQIKMGGTVFGMGLSQHHHAKSKGANGFCSMNALEPILVKEKYRKVNFIEVVDPEVWPVRREKIDGATLAEDLTEGSCYQRVLLGPWGNTRETAEIHPAMIQIVEKIKIQVASSLDSSLVVDMWLSLGLDSHVSEKAFKRGGDFGVDGEPSDARKNMFFNDGDYKYFFDEMAKLWNEIPDEYRGNFRLNLEGGYNLDILKRISSTLLPEFYKKFPVDNNNNENRSMLAVDLDVNHGNGLKAIVQEYNEHAVAATSSQPYTPPLTGGAPSMFSTLGVGLIPVALIPVALIPVAVS